MIAVIAVTGVDATNKTERERLSNDVMKNRLGSAKARSAMKAKRSKSLPMVVRDPNDTEKRAIAAAKQAIAEMEPRVDVGTRIKTENGAIQIQQGQGIRISTAGAPSSWRPLAQRVRPLPMSK